ncbi:MAG: hypothetical protein Q4P84_01790 [Elusimicrobiales bacterium]|uniref:hypothetical protein n=1 Tax=Candidatus Avelusimicrobium sp. TaxID=3048833 RepID=UPI001B0A22C4|nr:hypothetical protein [Elusimicrobiaceae bacterium]MDD6152551.1 hypothetical protein [Elusimicrobiota bacterium]MDO5764418.1 hypothetical protein [Elusimicrobiales bacterium]MBP3513541.1 hypothetical protein [Elusimicrobiaceae bacterium]MDD7578646.1 hypothetical protein [Elusimicrobiota bacterium]
MKVEIKKIGISSLLFSVFPLAVFVVMLVSAFMEVFNPEASINMAYVMGLIMRAIQGTLLVLVSSVFFLLAYNLLCAVGIRGVRVELEDK